MEKAATVTFKGYEIQPHKFGGFNVVRPSGHVAAWWPTVAACKRQINRWLKG